MDAEYHVVFETLACRQYFKGDVARIVTDYVRERLPSDGVKVLALSVMPDHIHMLLSGIHVREEWNRLLCNLQKEITVLLHQEYPERKWPRFIWVYNWWFDKVKNERHHYAVERYIRGQPKHHGI